LWELEQMELSVLTDLCKSETTGMKGKKNELFTVYLQVCIKMLETGVYVTKGFVVK
jgi:hypothetical protein